MHLPAHPVWFWLIMGIPLVVWSALWAVARFGQVSMKPLTPWLKVGLFLFISTYFLLDVTDGHKALRFGVGVIGYTCWGLLLWIQHRDRFESLRSPSAKWYIPFNSAKFSIPTNVRILVKDVNSVSPWYTDKLGLRKSEENLGEESGAAAYKFKEDGKSVVLTTMAGFGTEKTPILFTKKITRMKAVLAARGVDAGPIEQDRQGTLYFEIHDPEGNAIEVVQAS